VIRTVLSVALAAALTAAVAPALDDARTERTERLVAGELDRVAETAERLAAEESPAKPGEPGPRRTLTVSLPSGSPTAAPVSRVALGGRPDGSAADPSSRAGTDADGLLVAAVEGGRRQIRRVDVDLRAAESVGGENEADTARPLVLRAGSHRLVLRLVSRGGRPVVLVARAS